MEHPLSTGHTIWVISFLETVTTLLRQVPSQYITVPYSTIKYLRTTHTHKWENDDDDDGASTGHTIWVWVISFLETTLLRQVPLQYLTVPYSTCAPLTN
jgi:hypothetical protein